MWSPVIVSCSREKVHAKCELSRLFYDNQNNYDYMNPMRDGHERERGHKNCNSFTVMHYMEHYAPTLLSNEWTYKIRAACNGNRIFYSNTAVATVGDLLWTQARWALTVRNHNNIHNNNTDDDRPTSQAKEESPGWTHQNNSVVLREIAHGIMRTAFAEH